MLSFALDDEQQMIVDTIRQFARDQMRPSLRRAEKQGAPEEALLKEYEKLELVALEFPQEVGGSSLGAVTGALCGEELSYGDAGLTVALHGPGSLDLAARVLGSPAQQASLLGPFVKDRTARGAVAFADAAPAPDREGLATRAERDGAGWRLYGRKGLVLDGRGAGRLVVFAQVDASAGWDGLGAFVVERADPNLRFGERARLVGLGAVDASPLTLEGCYVPDEARLAAPNGMREGLRGFFAALQMRTAARMVGLARASYEYALEYASGRYAFGKPIAHFQGLAFMLSDMLMDVESMRWLTWRAAARADAKERHYREAAEAFSHAAEYGQRVAERAVQILGGAGYVQDHPVEKWMRDAKALSLLGGSIEAARQVVAEEDLGRGDSAPLADLIPTPDIQAVLV